MVDHRALIDHPQDFRWKLERHWTCPDHDYPHSHECDCEYCDRRWSCTKCAEAEWEILLDEDGWATLIFYEKTMFDRILEEYYLPQLRADLNRTHYGG